MYFDQHTHSHHSGDGRDAIAELVSFASSDFCSGITITDHCNFGYSRKKDLYTPIKESYEEYLSLKEKLPFDFFLGFGIEIGQATEDKESVEAAKWFPYDVVLGSVHSVAGKKDYCTWGGKCQDAKKEMEEYLLAELETAKTTDFDILTHLTYPWRYMEHDLSFPKIEEFFDITDEIFKVLISKGKALELNISGLCRTPSFSLLPNGGVLKRFKELGGELVTLGTDSHVKEQCGKHLLEGAEVLKEAGFSYLALFEKRKPKMIKL